MGPGIQEYPLLLHRETQKKESQINENHKGMVNYSNGKSHPSTKGLNKPISHVKSSGRLGKNVSSAIEKINTSFLFVCLFTEKGYLVYVSFLITSHTVSSFQISHETEDGNQPSIFKKGRNQLDDNTQSKR
ncbi:hypothetical protein N322_10595 [Cariama cristata]|uniref:Uncharacterized protein n=1 Tax=Cariama cristata TaxID=54380 RepID=A0A091MW50_CARIC|nr:hypothetical protein N322_10595 [Cariama cristata]